VGRGIGKGAVCYNARMQGRLKDLMKCIKDWPEGAQDEAVAALETIAGYVCLHEPSHDDR
jgi:hypothetical protein